MCVDRRFSVQRDRLPPLFRLPPPPPPPQPSAAIAAAAAAAAVDADATRFSRQAGCGPGAMRMAHTMHAQASFYRVDGPVWLDQEAKAHVFTQQPEARPGVVAVGRCCDGGTLTIPWVPITSWNTNSHQSVTWNQILSNMGRCSGEVSEPASADAGSPGSRGCGSIIGSACGRVAQGGRVCTGPAAAAR